MTATETPVRRVCRPRVLIRDDVLDGRVFQAECAVCRWEGTATSYEPSARIEANAHRLNAGRGEGR